MNIALLITLGIPLIVIIIESILIKKSIDEIQFLKRELQEYQYRLKASEEFNDELKLLRRLH